MTAVALQAQRQGRYAEATALFGETVELWQQVANSTAVDLARSNMANAAKAEGNFPLAQALLEQVAAACLARHDVRGVASALNGLGDVAAARGELAAARRYHHQSLEKFSQVNDQWGRARVLSDLAQINIDALRPRGGDGPAQGGAAGVPGARPSARHRPSARIACALCR